MTEAILAAALIFSAVSAAFSALAWAERKRKPAEKFEEERPEDGEAKRLWDEGVAGILAYCPDRGRGDRE